MAFYQHCPTSHCCCDVLPPFWKNVWLSYCCNLHTHPKSDSEMRPCWHNFELNKCSAWLLRFSHCLKNLEDLDDLSAKSHQPMKPASFSLCLEQKMSKTFRNALCLQALYVKSQSLTAWRWDWLGSSHNENQILVDVHVRIYSASSFLVLTNTRIRMSRRRATVARDGSRTEPLAWIGFWSSFFSGAKLYDTGLLKTKKQTQEVEPKSLFKNWKTVYIPHSWI